MKAVAGRLGVTPVLGRADPSTAAERTAGMAELAWRNTMPDRRGS